MLKRQLAWIVLLSFVSASSAAQQAGDQVIVVAGLRQSRSGSQAADPCTDDKRFDGVQVFP